MCESKRRGAALRGAVAAAGGVLLAGWVLRVVAAAGSVVAAVVAVEGAAAAVGAVVLVRLLGRRRPGAPVARCWLCGATAARAALALDGAGGVWAWVCADGPRCVARAHEALEAPRRAVEGVIISSKEAVR